MAEMTLDFECATAFNQTQPTNKSVVKKKFEKIKTKLVELFFTNSNSNNNSSNNNVQQQSVSSSNKTLSNNNSSRKNSTILIEPLNNTITNYYYGYKSHLEHNNYETDSKNKSITNISSSISTVSSSIKQQQQQQPLHQTQSNQNSKMIDSFHFDTSSLNTNNFDSITNSTDFASCFDEQYNQNGSNHHHQQQQLQTENPFLNSDYIKLITLNSNLEQLMNIYEPHMHLIDEQDNFFDINFMTNYIAYILVVKIKTSEFYSQLQQKENVLLKQLNDSFLLDLAKQIYTESEVEPCGLKGCHLSIYLENVDQQNNDLLTQFRFDSSSSLTTFQLNLYLKRMTNNNDSLSGGDVVSLNESIGNQSSFATLTKRFLNRTSSSKCLETTNTNSETIYLDPMNYNLFKCNLY